MPRLLLVSLLSCLLIGSCFAQNKKIDSLRAVLAKHPQADTFRVNRMNELAKALLNRQEGYDSLRVQQSEAILAQTLRLAKQLKYPYGQAFALYNRTRASARANPKQYQLLLKQALVLAQQSQAKGLQLDILADLGNELGADNNQALLYYQQGLLLAKRWKLDHQIVGFLGSIGFYYSDQGNYAQALDWEFRALKAARQAHDTPGELTTLLFISSEYRSLADYDQALAYGLQYDQLAHRSANQEEQKMAVYNLGNCYRMMGRYPKAMAAYEQLLTDTTNFYRRIFSLGYLAEINERVGQLSTGIRYAFQCIALVKKYHDWLGLISPSLALSRAHQKSNQADSALYYGRQAFRIAQDYRSKEELRDASQLLAQLYAQRHEYAKAYAYQRRYMGLKDTLNNEEVTRKATAMRFTEQMSRQQSQIRLLQKDKQLQAEAARRQRQLLYTSLVVLALIGGLLALLYHNNRQKQRANALLQHQRDQTQQALMELKATQQQLIQKEKMASLGELTAGIAHEIQNPLNFVNNFAEVSTDLVDELQEGPLQQLPSAEQVYVVSLLEDLTGNLKKINHHGQRAASIVRGMLEHSRSTSGEVQPTDLNTLANEYLHLAYHGQRAKDKTFSCELVTQFDPAMGQVNIMAQEMGRVLLNLFNNAFYTVKERSKQADTDYKSTVSVSTARTKEGVQIHVSDNGTGIPESTQQKIFQPFFTTKPTGEGTGLGLSLSYDIVTKGHNGSLMVKSQLGYGSEFVICLPV